jgi:hypothetical protein
MSAEAQLEALLNPLAAGGCHAIKNTDTTITYPYITYQVIAEIPIVSLTGHSGLDRKRMQLDVLAKSYPEAKILQAAIKAAMASATFTNVPLFSMDFPEDGVEEFRVLLEYSIWQKEA